MKIIDKINNYISQSHPHPFFSYEFFPPKTADGVDNLYQRIERMTALEPMFIDITWGAGGSTEDKTMEICKNSKNFFGVDVLMHITCAQLKRADIIRILRQAKDNGIHNILALRGDQPKEAFSWSSVEDGIQYAIELVKLIKEEFGDYFCIGVAGFPEGHPQSSNFDEYISHLKAKVDAGAEFILTQFFYDLEAFNHFVSKCRDAGIQCPIIPGMMPIQSFTIFQKMVSFCKTRVPQSVIDALTPIKDNDEEVKAFGVQLCVDMCRELMKTGTPGFHFYTLNLEKSTLQILKEIGVDNSVACRKALPWRGSRSNLKGMSEDVRPINWANRTTSYIKRTLTWDEFPNGRWGDNRSPAFGDLSTLYHSVFKPLGTREERLAMWGEAPIELKDIYEVFARYVEGKIPSLPWCESALQTETSVITTALAAMNRFGFLTVNSQPAVNGEKSDHPVFGWGGPGGRVYQKSYLEFFLSPQLLRSLIKVINGRRNICLHAVDVSGNAIMVNATKGVTALTWGVFPNKEVLQPTIFDHDTFLVWSAEAFQCWLSSWALLYDDETESSGLIYDIHDKFYLAAVIDNDFVESNLFSVFQEVMQYHNYSLSRDQGEPLVGGIEM